MVNYILSVTRKEQLSYIGHSQGTTMGFAGFSKLPDLSDKVNLFVALAPVATVHHIEGALSYIAGYYKELDVSVASFVYYWLSIFLSFCSVYLVTENFFQMMTSIKF